MLGAEKKRKKLKRMSKSILSNKEQCFLCGKQYGLEKHHIYAGIGRRKISEANGFWVYLCAFCHRSKDGAQYAKTSDDILKKICQEEYEKTHTREEFRKLIGKSYL